jgi:hypothetical protein
MITASEATKVDHLHSTSQNTKTHKPHPILPSIQIKSTMKLNLLLLSATALVNAATATEPVNLRTAGNYTILAKTGISTVPNSLITGNIAVSPIAAAAITGFSMVIDSEGEFSTASQFTGRAFAADYAEPTPTILTTAVSDMQTAYLDASSRPNEDGDRIDLGAGAIGSKTLTTGVYTFGTDIRISSDMYFAGSSTDVFIIQTTGSLLQAANTQVILSGGAQAKNIFWQVAGNVRVGAGAALQGIVLVKTDALFTTGSSLNGRVFAQTACDLQMATITEA